MDFKVVWTEPAIEDLRQICFYISADNPFAAQQVGDDIFRHVEILGSFPFIGPSYPRGSPGEIREIICRNYRIFYRVKEETKVVEILTIWHGAREERHLKF